MRCAKSDWALKMIVVYCLVLFDRPEEITRAIRYLARSQGYPYSYQ